MLRLALILSFLALALPVTVFAHPHPPRTYDCETGIYDPPYPSSDSKPIYLPSGIIVPAYPPPTEDYCDWKPGKKGSQCHVRHGATPAQICSTEGGMQYWFIGADGSAQPGPFLPDAPNQIERYEGVNSLTGKPVVIDYVVEGKKKLLRVSTYYPDNKPYIFTLDPGHAVNFISW